MSTPQASPRLQCAVDDPKRQVSHLSVVHAAHKRCACKYLTSSAANTYVLCVGGFHAGTLGGAPGFEREQSPYLQAQFGPAAQLSKYCSAHNGFVRPSTPSVVILTSQKALTCTPGIRSNAGEVHLDSSLRAFLRVVSQPKSYWCPLCGRQYWTRREANGCRKLHRVSPHTRLCSSCMRMRHECSCGQWPHVQASLSHGVDRAPCYSQAIKHNASVAQWICSRFLLGNDAGSNPAGRSTQQQNSRVGDGKLASPASPPLVVNDAPTLDPYSTTSGLVKRATHATRVNRQRLCHGAGSLVVEPISTSSGVESRHAIRSDWVKTQVANVVSQAGVAPGLDVDPLSPVPSTAAASSPRCLTSSADSRASSSNLETGSLFQRGAA